MKKDFSEPQLPESASLERNVGFKAMKDVIRAHRQLGSDDAKYDFPAYEALRTLHDELGFYLPLHEEEFSGLERLYEEDPNKFGEVAEFMAEDLLRFEKDLPNWAKEVLERYLQLKTNH